MFEVLTTYPGVHALALHRVAHRFWRWRLKWLARWLSLLARWLTGIEAVIDKDLASELLAREVNAD